MDDLVLAAMARWPDVPAMYGWLRLDRRGQWLLVDRGREGFDEARDGAGSPITSPPIIDFIGRNYGSDPQGRWYWQNGPQRVFVDLDLAPLVYRVMQHDTRRTLVTHTGFTPQRIDAIGCDAAGDLYVLTDLGPGVIHDMDLAQLDFTPGDDGDTLESVALGDLQLPLQPPAQFMPVFDKRPRAD